MITKRICLGSALLLSLSSFSLFTATAMAQAQSQPEQDNPPQQISRAEIEDIGSQWFDRMATALRELNFDASLVQVQGERIEPLRWLHGIDSDNQEIELVMRLNGPDSRILRFHDQTAYYQPASNSYSLRSNVIHGIIPAAFYQDFSSLADFYRAVPVGGARIVDRDAQHIRLVSKDNLRYGYSLWLDKESGMLLKSAMVTPQGEVVEQIQLTSLVLHPSFPANLEDLREVPRPPLLYDTDSLMQVRYKLIPEWLPVGFKLRRSNHHRVAMTGQRADYFLFSDGLTEFSVYIAEAAPTDKQALAVTGADSLYSVQKENYLVTVVGKLPIETARRIAEQVRVEPIETNGTAQP